VILKKFIHCLPIFEIPKLVRVDGNDGRYYTDPEENRYSSVTTILKHNPEKIAGLNRWRKRVGLEEATKITVKAGNRGTKIHSLAEKYLKNQFENEEDVKKACGAENLPLFEQMLPVLNLIDRIWHQEISLYSKTLLLAGTVDLIGEYNGKLSVVDFKTSLHRKQRSWIDDYFYQACAYSLAYEELTGVKIPNLVVIIACDDGSVQEFVENRVGSFRGLKESIERFRLLLK